MGIKHFRAYTPSRRNMTVSSFDEITKKRQKNLYLQRKRKMQVETHTEELQ